MSLPYRYRYGWKTAKGQNMNDPEVARLRRLRGVALRVREIARALGSAPWAKDDGLFSRGAGASWRIARVVSGKLHSHPYLRYQQGAGLDMLVANRLVATVLSAVCKTRLAGLNVYQARLMDLMRHVEDVRALTWSTEFSDTLGRSLAELRSLIAEIGVQTQSGTAVEHRPSRAPQADRLVGELAQTIEGDWPYLAF
jgi:hypothetical protein